MKKLISLIIATLIVLTTNANYSEDKTSNIKTAVAANVNTNLNIDVVYNGIKITFKDKPFLIGKEIMVPAEPLFKMLNIVPKIDKVTGAYSFNFDGADVSFNPTNGNLTFAQHYMPYTTHKLSKTCLVKNKVLYLNASKFPFCWLGAGADTRISSDSKSAKLYMSTELKIVDERFKVSNSRNGEIKRTYKKDPNKPLDVSWGINVSYEILPVSRKYSALGQSLPVGESTTEYQIFKYNGGSYGDIRSLLSTEMAVYDIMLYKNGVLVKTLHDFAPPRSGQTSSIVTTTSDFDEIRFKASYIKINDLDKIFIESGITIEVIDEKSLINEMMNSYYFESLSFYDSERSTPVIATNSLLNQGSTTYADGSRLIKSVVSTNGISESTKIERAADKYDNFNSMPSKIILTNKPHAIALYDRSMMLIKVVYLN